MPHDQVILDFSDRAVKTMVKRAIDQANGLHWFELRKCRDQRSLEQNSFFHGVWLPRIAIRMSELYGEQVHVDDCKEFLKARFLRVPIINRNTGEPVGETIRHTSDLEKPEFSEFLEKVFRFCIEQLDLTLPDARKFREEAEQEIPL